MTQTSRPAPVQARGRPRQFPALIAALAGLALVAWPSPAAGQTTADRLPTRPPPPAARAGAAPQAAPRASHALAWARDLMIAAESPLVPGSKHAGGALVARDPSGQEAKLTLRRYHVDVHIEDGFARTTIDQTYFNDSA